MAPHVLVVDGGSVRTPDPGEALRSAGFQVIRAAGGGEAADALAVPGLDYLVLDLSLPALDLPFLQAALAPAGKHQPDSLEAGERRHIAAALAYTGGNRREAARLLGIARSTLLAKLRKYGLEGRPGRDLKPEGPA